jgi:hypothetical protein
MDAKAIGQAVELAEAEAKASEQRDNDRALDRVCGMEVAGRIPKPLSLTLRMILADFSQRAEGTKGEGPTDFEYATAATYAIFGPAVGVLRRQVRDCEAFLDAAMEFADGIADEDYSAMLMHAVGKVSEYGKAAGTAGGDADGEPEKNG